MLPKILKQVMHTISSPPTKLALVVRGDIKMSKGKTAAQCSHAAILCYQQAQEQTVKRRILDAWCTMGQPKIVLRVDAYDDILKLQKEARQVGVVTAIVQDAGRTQLEPGTATVLGVGPDTCEEIDKLVAHLKLL